MLIFFYFVCVFFGGKLLLFCAVTHLLFTHIITYHATTSNHYHNPRFLFHIPILKKPSSVSLNSISSSNPSSIQKSIIKREICVCVFFFVECVCVCAGNGNSNNIKIPNNFYFFVCFLLIFQSQLFF